MANKIFQLKSYHGAKTTTVLKDVDPKVIALDGVLTSYQGLPQLHKRSAARHMLNAGGQGIKRCNCRGAYSNKQCFYFKAGRKCAPRCYKSNHNCQNC